MHFAVSEKWFLNVIFLRIIQSDQKHFIIISLIDVSLLVYVFETRTES